MLMAPLEVQSIERISQADDAVDVKELKGTKSIGRDVVMINSLGIGVVRQNSVLTPAVLESSRLGA